MSASWNLSRKPTTRVFRHRSSVRIADRTEVVAPRLIEGLFKIKSRICLNLWVMNSKV